MPLPSGVRLGVYEVLSPLGAGGMGEVYRARDSRLKRDVALKILPETFASDADRLGRFDREAEVLASLNHPNIAQVYGLEEGRPDSAGPIVRAIVMELVGGETLADRVARGPIPLGEALQIARQVADALEAAHDMRVVHRDLKPANIKVRPDGTVKVLDFGLAKLTDPAAADANDPNLSRSPTITSPAMTRAGVVLGTAAYMSPEQARGKPVDTRSDIWAFGCVLYEMLTGRRAFDGESITDVLAAVVNRDPDLTGVPPAVRPLVERCLRKDARHRLRHIGDAMAFIETTAARTESVAPVVAARSRRLAWTGLAALAIAAVAGVGVSLVHFRERAAPPRRARLQIAFPAGTSGNLFTASPDGRFLLVRLVTGTTSRLAQRSFETGEIRDLPGTTAGPTAGRGFYSHDGSLIGFSSQGVLKKIAAAGGTPQVLVTNGAAPNGTGCWANGEIVFQNNSGGFSRVAETGGEPTVLTTVDWARGELHHESPSCLPDGRFLYFRHLQERGASGIYVGLTNLPADKQSLAPVLVADDGPLFVRGSRAVDDRLLFMQGETLFSQRFVPERLELVGEPVPIADHVAMATGSVVFAATADGTLVYRPAVNANRQLTWFDRQGTVTGTVGAPNPGLRSLRIAPDGTRAAIGQFPPDQRINNDDIWVLPFTSGPATRMTSESAVDLTPVWAEGGDRVAFTSNRDGQWAIYQQAVGSTTARPLSIPSAASPTTAAMQLSDWSRDGRFILMTIGTPQTRGDLWVLSVTPDGATPSSVVPLVRTPFSETGASFSPDGRWIAYLSDESGRNEVYVRNFMVAADGTPSSPESGKRLVSNGAWISPRWRGDGRELVYLGADGRMMSLDMSAANPGAQAPRALFSVPAELARPQPVPILMDVLPDASRFLVAMPPNESPRTDLEVVLNWQ